MNYKTCQHYNFDHSSSFPQIQNGIVCSAEFETCKENKLFLRIAYILHPEINNGFIEKAWWVIVTPNLPDRFVKLSKGKKSLERLLQNYGFSDKTGCVHYKKGKVYTVNCIKDMTPYDVDVPNTVKNINGIPQRLENSGICWYAATCFAFFFCKQLRELITGKMKDQTLVSYCNECLKDHNISELLRKKLWYEYAFGDDVNQKPELDGQNGLTQFSILASKLDIPMKRFFVTDGAIVKLSEPVKDQQGTLCPIRDNLKCKNEPHILVIRFYRGDHHTKYKPMRRFVHNGIKYKLASMLLGSMHCGHQIGASSFDLLWRRWAISDSDASMFGIGPVHFCAKNSKCKQKEEWWSYWRHMIPLTVFGSQKQFCDLSPHNRPTGELQHKPSSSDVGDLNLDLIYVNL